MGTDFWALKLFELIVMWPLLLSIRYFLAKRKQGIISFINVISVAGVALGVAALIIVISVMNGFDKEIKDKIIGTYAHIIVVKDTGIDEEMPVVRELERVKGVKNAAGFISGQAVLIKGRSVVGILLKGIEPYRENRVSNVVDFIHTEGGALDGKGIVIGSELADNLGIVTGEEVELMVPYSPIDIKKKKFRVIGTFTSGRYDYDANMAVVHISAAQDLFRMGSAVNGIGVKLDKEFDVTGIRDRIQLILGPGYVVKSWMDLDSNLVSALALEKKMMFIILSIIVIVACFNICSSLVMMIMEKSRDIGILKALGANTFGVSMVFLWQSMVVGALGVVSGGVLGVFISGNVNEILDLMRKSFGYDLFPNDVYYFSNIPVLMQRADIISIVGVAMALAVVSGLYPAWKAARLDPVEAIRYE